MIPCGLYIYARMAEYICAFRYILNKWYYKLNNCVYMTHQDRLKLRKGNSRICDLKCGQITATSPWLSFIYTPHFSNSFVFWLTVIFNRASRRPTVYPSEIKNIYCNSGFCLVMTKIHFLKGDRICRDIWSWDTANEIDNNNLQPFLEATCLLANREWLNHHWRSKYAYTKQWNMTIHPCPNFNGGITKPLFKFWNGSALLCT